MKSRVFIPYVKPRDLLVECLNSIKEWWSITTVINNSGESLDLPSDIRIDCETPSQPLGFAQTMNHIQAIAEQGKLDYYMFLHSDALITNNVHLKLLTLLDELEEKGENWGAIFTNYDVLAIFKTEALRQVGPWDTIAFPWYFSDNDYYRRITLAGYKIVPAPFPGVIHQNGSSNTLRNDPRRKLIENIYNQAALEIYRIKWGGNPNEETVAVPAI